MKLVIHSAHAEVINNRISELRQLELQFSLLKMEEKRTTDALLKAAGFDPDKYPGFKMVRDGDAWAMDLTEAPKTEPTPGATPPGVGATPPSEQPEKRVNGAA